MRYVYIDLKVAMNCVLQSTKYSHMEIAVATDVKEISITLLWFNICLYFNNKDL